MHILRMGITKNAYAVVEDGSARRLAPALHYPSSKYITKYYYI